MNYRIDYDKINRSKIIDCDMEINEEIREDRVNYIILENGFLGEMIDKEKKVEDIVVIPKPINIKLCDKVMVYRAFIHYYYYRNLKDLDFSKIENKDNKENIKKIEIILTDSISVCYLKNIPETVKYIILYNINDIQQAKNDLYYNNYHSEIKLKIQKDILNKFEKSKYGILTNVYCLGEGTDIPILSGQVFSEKMISPIRIF